MSDQAIVPAPHEHHWVSTHEPGHILYWVAQCSLCHRVDWDALDGEIRKSVWEMLTATIVDSGDS